MADGAADRLYEAGLILASVSEILCPEERGCSSCKETTIWLRNRRALRGDLACFPCFVKTESAL